MSEETIELVNAFAKAFVMKSRRDRMVSIVSSKKMRTKFRSRLAHKFIDDLDIRYVFKIADNSEEIKKRETALLKVFFTKKTEGKCYVISEQKELDDKFLTIDEVDEQIRDGMGTIVIVVPAHLAYYYGEEMNADYILIRI